MSFYAERLFPHGLDWGLGSRKFQEQRREALRPLRGEVLELGFGTGLNLPHYPAAVTRVVALDPASLLRKKVAGRIAAAPMAAALQEVARVLKPDGRYVFLEHGRSDRLATAKWQDRLNPLQQRIGVGCNMNRPIDRLITEAGLKLEHLDRFRMPGIPRLLGEMYRGSALPH
jgi:hypothetical protein